MKQILKAISFPNFFSFLGAMTLSLFIGLSPAFAQADLERRDTGSFRSEPFINKPVGDISGPVVAELFTSQSCSSCPPADAFLQEVTERYPHIIALSCHVTYWNYLHWKDTLSKEFCSDRQRAYAKEHDTPRVFTPELRVNGRVSVVGSNEDNVYRALATERNRVAEIGIKKTANAIYELSLPALFTQDYLVEVLYYGGQETVSIPSGENAGKTIQYKNPVRRIDVVKNNWDGEQQSMSLTVQDLDAEGFVVLAHSDNQQSGTIVAAGQIKY